MQDDAKSSLHFVSQGLKVLRHRGLGANRLAGHHGMEIKGQA